MARDNHKEYLARKARIAAGTVGSKPGRPRNTPERLWQQVDKRSPDECWNWTGYLNNGGYGRTQIDGKSYYAHRVIFNLVNPGMIELSSPRNKQDSGFLMHSCDNPRCCNPNHLKVATIKENNNDCQAKGRRNLPTGENHHRSVFSNKEVEEIFALAKQGHSTRQIAELTGKNRNSIKGLFYRNRIDPQPRAVTTDEEIATILEMRLAGSTAKHIADTMNKNLSTVKSVLQRHREA